jgi:glycosyltransferase involved in cell wall biosynthesis
VRFSSALRRCRRKLMAVREGLRNALVAPARQPFCVVSCSRNAGDYALRCLESVFAQNYDRRLVRHLFIDDASDDGTHDKILTWLAGHPGHCVEYLHREVRCGGTFNTVDGIGQAGSDAIVIELNGDDWLPDPGVLSFFSRVYADNDVWMTYNTCRVKNGPPADWARPFSRDTIARNAFRDVPVWTASHLHTFRKRLYDHLATDVFIDPLTGSYWECADDQALYLGLLELAGRHSRHIDRITCVYNYWEASHSYQDRERSIATAERVRQGRKYQPLLEL